MTDTFRRRNLDADMTVEDHVQTQGQDDHLQAKKRGLEQTLPSWSSVGSNLADTWILDIWLPEL